MKKIKCILCENEVFSKGFHSHLKNKHNLTTKVYYDKYIKKEEEGRCLTCRKDCLFLGIERGYRRFCSNKACVNQNQETREKIKKTCLEKYGQESNLLLNDVKEKRKEQMKANHGVFYGFQSRNIQDKVKKTLLSRYGVTNPGCSFVIKNKTKQTLQARYGVEHNFSIPFVRENIESKRLLQIKDLEEDYKATLLRTLVRKYGQGWYKSLDFPRIIYGHLNLVPNDYIKEIENYSTSSGSCFEKEVYRFLVENLEEAEVHRGNRSLISPLEVDFYLPKYKVAIECDGIYWHKNREKNYHLKKTLLCQEKGIRLIHINDWEWKNKKEICKSIVLGALGIYENRIFARKCEIKEVDRKLARSFLEENHLQGFVNAKYSLGLFFDEELVQIITLGASRFKQGEIELLRMCTKNNYSVVGGFSRLIKGLPLEFTEIVSYVDLSKFAGNGYLSTGWEFIKKTEPNYFYFKGNIRYSRNACQKHKLEKLLGKDIFRKEKTEKENMLENGFSLYYDCGNLKLKLDRSKR